ncbi:MAG: adenosylcobinamide-GDP ribazoletransferase [Rhodobacteraceae bacterium]|nr:adenosylcobinamide-GDP ribazoletransferase [Paracoccaceae bacterium]
MSALAEARAGFLLALQFLTRLPVPDPGWTPERFAASTRWHPAAGALIGALIGLVWWGASVLFPPLVAVLFAVAFGLVLTGCFHEDGFADTCDGLGGAVTRDRALEIMKDSRIGTYGAAGVGMMLAVRVAALAALAPTAPLVWVLVASHAASRAASVHVIATSAYVRDHGTGKPVADGIGRDGLRFALLTGGAALLPLVPVLGVMAPLAGLAGLALGTWAIRRVYERRLGGYTGDCLGATQQCAEVGFYLGLLAWL